MPGGLDSTLRYLPVLRAARFFRVESSVIGEIARAIGLVTGITIAIAAVLAEHHSLRRFRFDHFRTLLSLKREFFGRPSHKG